MRSRSGKGLSSWLAGCMLIGTLGYVVRDNFKVGAAIRDAEVEVLCLESRDCLERGDVSGAVEKARRALEAAPEYLPAHLRLIEALTASGDLDGAAAALEVAAGLDAHNAEVRSAREALHRASSPASSG